MRMGKEWDTTRHGEDDAEKPSDWGVSDSSQLKLGLSVLET